MLSIPKYYFFWDSVLEKTNNQAKTNKKPNKETKPKPNKLNQNLNGGFSFAVTSPLGGHLPTHVCIFEAFQHTCALLRSALCTSTQPGCMTGLQKGAAVTMSSRASCQLQTTPANKLFLVCDIKYILLLFSGMKTCMSTFSGHTSTRKGEELALEGIVLRKNSENQFSHCFH